MYLMGMMMASMEDPESTSKRKERRRIRTHKPETVPGTSW
jgi:hypothetical protein